MAPSVSRTHPLGRVLVLVVCALASLGWAGQALAVDTLTPSSVVLTLEAGQSATVGKTLHLDGLPARADIIVAIDTTGSMGTPIAQAQADAINLCNTVQASIPGARFAVMDFEDYFPGPGAAGDVPYLLKTPGFTSSCAAFSAAIGTMTAVSGSGGDNPEAYNRAFFEAYANGTNPIVTTRDPLAKQFLVVLGDAEPHSATAFGACPARPPDDFGRNGVAGGGDDLNTTMTIAGLNSANIDLLMIRYTTGGVSVSLACYQDMANATGGTAVDSSSAPSIGDFIIANAQATPYTVDLAVAGQCPPVGLTFSPVPPYGPFTGEQTILFTETITAPTVPGNYTCTVTAVMSPGGPTTAVETINLTVLPGDPATLVLTPATDTNTVGDQHCVTATVRDAFGNPTPGITVRFSVTGSVTTSGSATTNAAGQAEFCYTGPDLPGADVITAYADTNNNGVKDATEPQGTATKAWVLPVSTPLCEIKINNGGWIIADNGDKSTFGGMAKSDGAGNVDGNEEYQDHGPATELNLHGDPLVVICTSATEATIYGQGTVNGALPPFFFRIRVQDNGESGKNDWYGIIIGNGYASGDKQLGGGNVQIHKTT